VITRAQREFKTSSVVNICVYKYVDDMLNRIPPAALVHLLLLLLLLLLLHKRTVRKENGKSDQGVEA
jgi:hypothetical protein